jgi:carotenoid cleavage dioxygenase-like enzyme
MPSSPEQASRFANDEPVVSETITSGLRVSGKLPALLSGQYLQIGADRVAATHPADWAGGEGMVHAVIFDPGRGVSYRNHWIGDDVADAHLVAFGNAILVLVDGALAYELNPSLDTVRRLDLAGARRSLAGRAAVDPHSGELHLLAFAAAPSQLHLTVSRGALTRTIRPIDDAPGRIRQLELTRDDVVLMADGYVGVTARAGINTTATWFEIDTEARHIVTASAHGESVIVHATGPSLVRWTLDRRAAVRCEVLDPTLVRFATSNRRQPGTPQRFLWTVGASAAHKLDLFTGGRRSHAFGDSRTPGELVFVADLDRHDTEDGGWLVGFVHDNEGNQAELVVLDAEVIERPAVATVHIPRRLPNGAQGTWFPA